MPEAPKNPPLSQWTMTASMLAQLVMEVRSTNAILISANSAPGKAAPKIVEVPVPTTALSRLAIKARVERRLERHDSLVARLLGDRAKK